MPPPRLLSPAAIDDVLLYRLARLTAVAGTVVVRLCEGVYGITRREWRLVALLAQEDGVLSSELAERARLDRARTSRAITSLAAKKLIQRQVGGGDRRQARIALTARGRTLYEELFPRVLEINRELLDALEPRQAAELDATLDALQARADAILARGGLPKADRRRGRARAPLG